MSEPAALAGVTVVLHQPRTVVNIGATVRAMHNMGFAHLRLVAPVAFTADEVGALAHRSEALLAATRSYANLDDALADMTYVVGTTDHSHGQYHIRGDVRPLASELIARAAAGPLALLFGPEDNGLNHDALERCHTLLRLPTSLAYPSLNLAQAVLLLLYELRMAALDHPPPLPAAPPPAPAARLETLFATWQQALRAVGFFKTPHTRRTLRTLRAVVHRATPTEHETALLTAIAHEVVRATGRKNDPPA